MTRYSLLGLSALVMCAMGGCASTAPRTVSASIFQKQKADLAVAEKSLASHDYDMAISQLKALVNSGLDSRLLNQTNFDLGQAYEARHQWKDAAAVYEEITQMLEGIPSPFQAQALHRLSLCYEAMDQDEKMLLALLELDSERDILKPEVGQVEVPARIAGAYARAGNFEEAEKYMARARSGLRQLRRKPLSADDSVWLPKTYYSMGHIAGPRDDFSVDDYNHYVDSLEQTQGYLLQAAEWEASPYASKAINELQSTYSALLHRIDTIRISPEAENDSAIRAMETQQTQKSLAAKLDEAIQRLKLDRLPPSPQEPEPVAIMGLFKLIDHIESQADAVIRQRDVRDK